MKTWLRLLLITMTVGGGFTGIAIAAQTLYGDPSQWLGCLLALAVFTFIVISGLLFVHNPQRILPLVVALALQVPWLSSPLVTYHAEAGSSFSVAVIGGNFTHEVGWLGSWWEFGWLSHAPWGVGVNLTAVVLLGLLWRFGKKPRSFVA